MPENKKMKFTHLIAMRDYLLQHVRPDILLIGSFALTILVGALLLMLPISVKHPLAFLDSLFIATSSTCVTGLVTKTVADQFTLFGQIIILILIQLGGLGVMTFVSAFLLFNKARMDFRERLLLKDALNKENFSGLSSYIMMIVRFTFICEGIGFVLFFIYFVTRFPLGQAFFNSLFLSVSAFCNAGIDTLGSTSLIAFQNNPLVNFTTMALIISGGLGFAVWLDIYEKIKDKKSHGLRSTFSCFSIHTKIVIRVTLYLIISGMVLILLTEWNGVLAGQSFPHKLIQALFNSVTLRTAGFATFDYGALSDTTKLYMIPYMLVGGSPGGTAGGFKTTTFLLLLLSIYVQFRGEGKLHVYKRQIDDRDYHKVTCIVLVYLLFLLVSLLLLTSSENMPFLDLFFEAGSAIGTVGLSTGITSALSSMGKTVIIALMFVGRVGPTTILFAFRHKKHSSAEIIYPHADILVG